ncbi:SEFIR domain-containing protein [Lederbergia lenta]|uniref:SEFIR domain-containing protein n=1 Tax=Lederbergia lenta TaxID=1467 RepID=UPI0020417156|nr:SEFIR domain-containing protein [Lederbergia lenta]MCM3109949.1 TIR domain-containing protein [Lederbergia lenta]
MNKESLTNPKIFISYSWSSEEYQEWVMNLAKRLVSDGVEVVIDKWDLKEGQDKYHFMEKMVSANDIDKVLILCDEKYQKRANSRMGGVGDETQIISSEIYGNVEQEKFIPIVTYRDQEGKCFLPHYMSSRIYFDLSIEDTFEEVYEQLLRSIYRVPMHQKPKLGKAPAFLTEREVDHFKTAYIIRKMESVIDKNPNRLKGLSNDFADNFIEILEDDFTIEFQEEDYADEVITQKIEETSPLKEDFVSMINILASAEKVDSDFIIEFFEKIYALTEHKGNGIFYNAQFDHYKYLITELYLHTIAILMKHKQYTIIAEVVRAEYHFESKYNRRENTNFVTLRFPLDTLRHRKARLKINKISLHADIICKRAGKLKKEIVEADLILYYISKINNTGYRPWFPTTYHFLENNKIRFFSRLKSKKHFELVKDIFRVETREDLISRITAIEYDRGHEGSFYKIPSIASFVNLEEIATDL